MGLLDVFNTYEGQQALGLLAAAGPRSDGAGFGQRLAEGLGSANKWKAGQSAQKMADLQVQQAQAEMQDKQRQLAQQAQLQELAKRFQGSPGLAPLQGNSDSGILPSAGKPATSFDYKGYAGAMANIDPMKALSLQQMLQKDTPINKLDVKDFTPASVAKFAQSQNYGDLVRLDKAHFANTGGQTVALDPYSGQPLNSIANTQSPDNAASNATTMRGQNMTNSLGWANHNQTGQNMAFTQSQAQKPQFHDGSWVTPPTPQNPQGTAMQVPGFNKPLTEAQGNAVSFALRAENALGNLKDQPVISNKDYYAAQIPWGMGNFAMSDKGQQAMNSEKQFIAAVLRKESGAAISQGEYTSYGAQLFPRPGDSKAVLDQKTQNRALAVEAMRIQAGQSGIRQGDAAFDKVRSGGAGGAWDAPAATATKAPMPMKGMVQNGYKFKGGNAADAANWEKM